MSKPVKIGLWIIGGIVGVFVLIATIGAMTIAGQPGGFEAERTRQEALRSVEASAKAESERNASSEAESSRNAEVAAKAASDGKAELDTKAEQDAEAAAAAKNKAEADRVTAEAAKENYGQSIYAEWLAARGVTSPVEILAQSPGSVQGYLVSAESPSSGTAIFTAQVTSNDVDKEELKQAAMAVLNLVGYENKSLERVEIVTADSLSRGVANRYDSKLLTLK